MREVSLLGALVTCLLIKVELKTPTFDYKDVLLQAIGRLEGGAHKHS